MDTGRPSFTYWIKSNKCFFGFNRNFSLRQNVKKATLSVDAATGRPKQDRPLLGRNLQELEEGLETDLQKPCLQFLYKLTLKTIAWRSWYDLQWPKKVKGVIIKEAGTKVTNSNCLFISFPRFSFEFSVLKSNIMEHIRKCLMNKKGRFSGET